jgi:CMP-N,N'-diacetyllegionaminic acid synthase
LIKDFKILAIICARGGSKGIPRKNIKTIAGLPLIAWTINAAKNSKLIDKISVSTDSKEISKIAKEYGAEVPILRPKDLSDDKIPKLPALQHMINWYEKNGENYDIIVDLDPTNPLRLTEDIDKAIYAIVNNKNADSIISVFESHHNPYWTMFEEKEGYLKISKNPKVKITCRQDQPKVLSISGNVVVSWRDTIIKKNTHSVNAKKCKGVFISEERSIDIDNSFEFDICEWILNNRDKK